MSNLEGPSETTTSIGRRCRGGDAYSRAILIARTLSPVRGPSRGSPGRQEHTRQEAAQQRQGMHPRRRPLPSGKPLTRGRDSPLPGRHAFTPPPLRGHASVMQTPDRRRAARPPETSQRRAGGRRRNKTKNLRRQQPGGSTSSHSEQRS